MGWNKTMDIPLLQSDADAFSLSDKKSRDISFTKLRSGSDVTLKE